MDRWRDIYVDWCLSFQGTPLSETIYAFDRDEPETDNARVGYAIDSLTVTNREGLEIPNLFYMETLCAPTIYNCSGRLWVNMDLQGYWGTYDIVIVVSSRY